MENFPRLPHQSTGGGIECCGHIVPEGWPIYPETTLRCDECGVVAGTINTGIFNDLVTLAGHGDGQVRPRPRSHQRAAGTASQVHPRPCHPCRSNGGRCRDRHAEGEQCGPYEDAFRNWNPRCRRRALEILFHVCRSAATLHLPCIPHVILVGETQFYEAAAFVWLASVWIRQLSR